MRFIVITILFCLTSVFCLGQSLKSLNKPEKINSKGYFLPTILLEDSINFTNKIYELKDSTVNTLILNERVDSVDSAIELLTNSKSLKYISFSPTQNPEIATNLGSIPNIEGYKLYNHKCESFALPNLENTKLKSLQCMDDQSWRSWYETYSMEERNKIFQNVKYLQMIDKINSSVTNFESWMFPKLKFIDIDYAFNTSFFNTKIHKLLGYRLFVDNLFNNLQPLISLKAIRFNGIPNFVESTLDIVGVPNLNFLAFYNCNLPSTINLNNIPLNTLVFWGSSKLPKLENADSITTLKTLLITGNNKRLKRLKIHERFISIEQLGIKGYKTGINSRKLSRLNQLTHYELYGVKDRSLGLKLPKEKNNLTTLKIEKSGLWWPPKNLEEYKNLDTLILEVAFYRKKRLKKALLNLPNLKYVKISKSWIKGVAPNNKAFTIRHVEGDGVYTKLEWEIKEKHPNDSLYLDIESKEYPLYYKNSPELESK